MAGWTYLYARFELASIEGREAVAHYFKALAILIGALVGLVFGYFFICFAVVFGVATAFGGGQAWIWVTLAMGLLHLLAGVGLLWMVYGLVRQPVFAATLEEFRNDKAWLEAKTENKS